MENQTIVTYLTEFLLLYFSMVNDSFDLYCLSLRGTMGGQSFLKSTLGFEMYLFYGLKREIKRFHYFGKPHYGTFFLIFMNKIIPPALY